MSDEELPGITLAWKLHFEFEELSFLGGSDYHFKIRSETGELPDEAVKMIENGGHTERDSNPNTDQFKFSRK